MGLISDWYGWEQLVTRFARLPLHDHESVKRGARPSPPMSAASSCAPPLAAIQSAIAASAKVAYLSGEVAFHMRYS